LKLSKGTKNVTVHALSRFHVVRIAKITSGSVSGNTFTGNVAITRGDRERDQSSGRVGPRPIPWPRMDPRSEVVSA
jgi:hypothetical protein